MEKQNIYKQIKSLADELCKGDKTYLRADLAFELKKFGVDSDSSDVSKLVFEAYKYYRQDNNIAIAFVSNNSRTTLVDEYKLNDSLEQGYKEEALKIAEGGLELTSTALSQLNNEITLNLNLVLAKGASKIADVVMGTNDVKDVRNKASVMFDKYSKMVETYHYAEDSVRSNIEDFTSLRSDIETTYREYAMKLIDIYGDSIKLVSPSLFDFKQVEWLDVDEMLKYVELEYNKIQDKCCALIAEISDSFRASLQSSLVAYKSASNSNKSLGLAMAGLEMLNHYMASSEKANRLKGDLTVLQASVKHDATRIKADMQRLMVICKTLNDVVIPKAHVYLRYAEKLLDSDFMAMTDSLYQNADIRPLEEQRQALLQELKSMDIEMNDHLQNVDVYSTMIEDISSVLSSKRSNYMEAKAKKPTKPFFLVNWLTLGSANRNYYRNFSEWDAVCTPLIREYENYQVDLKLDKDELASHQEALKNIKAEYSKVSSQLSSVSQDIRRKIVCSEDLKLNMLKHLRDIVAMLKLGREIMESKLDEKLIHVVDIPDFKDSVKLPVDLEQNLTNFTNLLADNLHADREMASNLLNAISQSSNTQKNLTATSQEAESKNVSICSEEELNMMTEKMEGVVQQGIALFGSMAKLKLQQLNGQLASASYDKELEKHTAKFRECLNKIDDKSSYLRDVFKRINLATNDDERKQAMELLSELSGFSLSNQDFEDFMNGKKQIEL